MHLNKVIDCGWGKLLFAQTFAKPETLAHSLESEGLGTRNIAFYTTDPHVFLAQYPQQFFLDPSHTYRKYLNKSEKAAEFANLEITTATFPQNSAEINDIYLSQGFIPLPEKFKTGKGLSMFIAREKTSQKVVGCCQWIDHKKAFNDVENGSSIWALAVNPTSTTPGIGLALVQECLKSAEKHKNNFLDLSVIHTNKQAISLYEKLGFEKQIIFSVKTKSSLNENLFVGNLPEISLNKRSKVIIEGARRRGISAEIIDEKGFFNLSFGGSEVACYESLTEVTNSIALKYCDNHRLTNIILANNQLKVPDQEEFTSQKAAEKFLEDHQKVVVKVLKGIKLEGTTVNIDTVGELKYAIEKSEKFGDRVLLEESVTGERFRFLIINFKVVSVLKVIEPFVVGTGKHSVRKLLQKLNRRQKTQFDEMRIPIDKELRTCLREQDCDLDFTPEKGQKIILRHFANSKKGEFLENIDLKNISQNCQEQAEKAAGILNNPVVAIEAKIKETGEFIIIQANERPSLTPPHKSEVIDLFLEFLFPQIQAQ